jgi:5'-methylthioadenosine phosphorylase
MARKMIGVIGGSGLYELEGLENIREERIETPFGDPSDAFILGELDGTPMVFLPRHGRGHVFTPSTINYRANIWGMKKLGVTHIMSVSACGSLQEEIEPGHIIVIDQFIDRTRGRNATFFGTGCVGHVAFADPICEDLADLMYETAKEMNIPVHKGGTYVCMEGPAFSTRAESHLYRSFGATVIGMTNVTEAKLAREGEICYATLAMATDYDCWREADADVDINEILATMAENVKNAKAIIGAAAGKVPDNSDCKCQSAAQFAVITAKEKISDRMKQDLGIIIGKYL